MLWYKSVMLWPSPILSMIRPTLLSFGPFLTVTYVHVPNLFCTLASFAAQTHSKLMSYNRLTYDINLAEKEIFSEFFFTFCIKGKIWSAKIYLKKGNNKSVTRPMQVPYSVVWLVKLYYLLLLSILLFPGNIRLSMVMGSPMPSLEWLFVSCTIQT